jgi:hypothetical protein
MAEKHKSKYKAPKDLEKSQKPKARKDLKDYTHDDKKGALNPKSTGEKQSNVLRKTDKEMVDDGKYDVKYNADDRLYKDLEDAEYDPKHAAKVFKKRQDKDEQDNEKNIQDKIENLTREGKERLVREYVRRKIAKILKEADEKAPESEEAPETETPDTPAPAPTAAPPAPAETPMPDMAAPALDTPPPADPTATTPTTPEAPEAPAAETPEQENPADAKQRVFISAANQIASNENPYDKIDDVSQLLRIATKSLEIKDKIAFFKALRVYSIKKLGKLTGDQTQQK